MQWGGFSERKGHSHVEIAAFRGKSHNSRGRRKGVVKAVSVVRRGGVDILDLSNRGGRARYLGAKRGRFANSEKGERK